MNSQNHFGESGTFSTRTTVNFPFLTTESLTELIDTLGFKMGLAELRYCQNCYRNGRLGNPTINELKIIDRVFYDNTMRADAALVSSFLTNDKLTADTYADLMARRNAVSPKYTAPCSLNEMLEILPKFLARKRQGEITLFAGKHRNVELSSSGCKKIAETGLGYNTCTAAMKIRTQDAAPILSGNIVYAILESFNRDQGFGERLDAFLSSPEMIRLAKRTIPVDKKSVITALISLGHGIKLDTLHYEGKDGAISPFEPLAEADSGIITVFNKSESVDMLLCAQLFGLRVIPLGYIASSQSIDGVSRAGEHLSLSLPFLRSLAFSKAVTCEADGNQCNIEGHASSAYINLNKDRYRMNSALCGGKNYYSAGFNTVLYSYSLCVASGADAVSSIGVYTFPAELHNEKRLGEALELVLGAYRAQCELELCDLSPKVELGESAELSFHTLAKTDASAPSKLTGKGEGIYYLEPLYTSDGLPDMDDLKKMHRYVKHLISSGAVLAIHPTTDDMERSLKDMSDTVAISYNAENLPKANYGGFIIESNQPIEGILIVKTACEEPLQSISEPILNT